MSRVSPQERILNALQTGARTWDDLRELTKISDERLGFTLGELFDLRKIWTVTRNGIRVYGLERRTGLVPRHSHPLRRAADKIDQGTGRQ